MKRRRLVIFIGHHKVGSTSLQAYLALNAEQLARQRILYPAVLANSPTVAIRRVARRVRSVLRGQPEYRRLQLFDREPHNALALKMVAEHAGRSGPLRFYGNLPPSTQMFATIHRQIEGQGPDTVILCGEGFANFAARGTALIEQLREEFYGYDVTLYCILRRIEDYLPSWYSQCISFGHKLPPLRGAGLQQFIGTIHVDYEKMLARWLEVFSRANFILRDYADVLEQGGAVNDFLMHAGIASPSGVADAVQLNQGIPHRFLEVCRLANWELESSRANRLREVITDLNSQGRLEPTERLDLLGENRQILMDIFQPVDSYLGGLVGRESFFAQPKKQPPQRTEKESFLAGAQQLEAGLDGLKDIGDLREFIGGLDLTAMERFVDSGSPR